MSMTTPTPDTSATDPQRVTTQTGNDGAAATGHPPVKPSAAAPGTGQIRDHVGEALNRPDEGKEVEPGDKGA